MKFKSLILMTVLATNVAFATYKDGNLICEGEPDLKVKDANFKTHQDTACEPNNSLQLPIYATMLSRKLSYTIPVVQDFEVGIIMRIGQDLSGIRVLKDDKSLSDLIDFVTTEDMNGLPGTRKVEPFAMEKQLDKTRKLEYSHIGFIIKNHPFSRFCVDQRGKKYEEWTTVHLLDPCTKGIGPKINDHKFGMFFIDDLFEYKTKILIPPMEIQKRIYDLVMDQKFTNNNGSNPILARHYNMASKWDVNHEENSNQWPLEILAAAYSNKRFQNRQEAQSVLKESGYRPTTIQATGKYAAASIGWLGKMFSVDLSAQPTARQFSIAQIVTALSVEEWMKKNNLIAKELVVELNAEDKTVAQYWVKQAEVAAAAEATALKKGQPAPAAPPSGKVVIDPSTLPAKGAGTNEGQAVKNELF